MLTSKDYLDSLDAAITALVMHDDPQPFSRHAMTYSLRHWPSRPESQRVAAFKGATARTSLPMEVRSRAKRWLIENGLQPWDDGDVPVMEQT